MLDNINVNKINNNNYANIDFLSLYNVHITKYFETIN